MKYLGVDYGKTKMGLAVSEGQLASPLKVVKINGLSDALSKIQQVIKQEEIERVVIGIPESGEAQKITRSFIKSIKDLYKEEPVEIIEAEETLSSFKARGLMIDLNLSGQSIKKQEDEYAAAIILQEFLDSLQ